MAKQKIQGIEFILRFLAAMMREEELTKAALALEIDPKALRQRLHKDPNLQLAKQIADEQRKTLADGMDFGGYVMERLSPESRKVWDDIQFWEDNFTKVEAILDGKAKRIRQELFIHALVTNCFDVSTALRVTGVSRGMLDKWRNDIGFRQLLEDIHWHKKNFFETALIKLVQDGNPAAVMFVNKTINRDRGYQEKVEVQHTGTISTGVDIETLDLDLGTRKAILLAMRKKREELAADNAKPIGAAIKALAEEAVTYED